MIVIWVKFPIRTLLASIALAQSVGMASQRRVGDTARATFRFYRATRMHSADYAVARCLSIRLFVCHTPVLSVNGYTYPQIFFTIR